MDLTFILIQAECKKVDEDINKLLLLTYDNLVVMFKTRGLLSSKYTQILQIK